MELNKQIHKAFESITLKIFDSTKLIKWRQFHEYESR